MINKTTFITVLVHDQDEAKKFYTEKLGFIIWQDREFEGGGRWLVVSPKKENECMLTLALANTEEQKKLVGKQAGERFLLVMECDDLDKTYRELKDKSVKFLDEPKDVSWGREVYLKDLYGNKINLIQG